MHYFSLLTRLAIILSLATHSMSCGGFGGLASQSHEAVSVPPTPSAVEVAASQMRREELVNRVGGIDLEAQRLISELLKRGIDVRQSERGVVVNLPDVLFTSGTAKLTESAKEVVFEISQVLKSAPSRPLSIEGHTDSAGTIERNYHLSESRAGAVKAALEGNGVAPEVISVRSFGETTPIATNRTEYGRRQNRRVEIVISP